MVTKGGCSTGRHLHGSLLEQHRAAQRQRWLDHSFYGEVCCLPEDDGRCLCFRRFARWREGPGMDSFMGGSWHRMQALTPLHKGTSRARRYTLCRTIRQLFLKAVTTTTAAISK